MTGNLQRYFGVCHSRTSFQNSQPHKFLPSLVASCSQSGLAALGSRLRSRVPSCTYTMMPQPATGAAPNPQAQPPMQQYPHQTMAAPPPPTQHQQWMMMMQQQAAQPVPPPAGWTPQPVPPPVPAQMQQYPASPYASGEIKSLWIGDLQPHMDESYLGSCFAHTGEVLD